MENPKDEITRYIQSKLLHTLTIEDLEDILERAYELFPGLEPYINWNIFAEDEITLLLYDPVEKQVIDIIKVQV